MAGPKPTDSAAAPARAFWPERIQATEDELRGLMEAAQERSLSVAELARYMAALVTLSRYMTGDESPESDD